MKKIIAKALITWDLKLHSPLILSIMETEITIEARTSCSLLQTQMDTLLVNLLVTKVMVIMTKLIYQCLTTKEGSLMLKISTVVTLLKMSLPAFQC